MKATKSMYKADSTPLNTFALIYMHNSRMYTLTSGTVRTVDLPAQLQSVYIAPILLYS